MLDLVDKVVACKSVKSCTRLERLLSRRRENPKKTAGTSSLTSQHRRNICGQRLCTGSRRGPLAQLQNNIRVRGISVASSRVRFRDRYPELPTPSKVQLHRVVFQQQTDGRLTGSLTAFAVSRNNCSLRSDSQTTGEGYGTSATAVNRRAIFRRQRVVCARNRLRSDQEPVVEESAFSNSSALLIDKKFVWYRL